jgi:hypothetical protein
MHRADSVTADMNPAHADPAEEMLLRKDAVVFSCHKFIGGPSSSGILVVKRQLFHDDVPFTPGMLLRCCCAVLLCLSGSG